MVTRNKLKKKLQLEERKVTFHLWLHVLRKEKCSVCDLKNIQSPYCKLEKREVR